MVKDNKAHSKKKQLFDDEEQDEAPAKIGELKINE